MWPSCWNHLPQSFEAPKGTPGLWPWEKRWYRKEEKFVFLLKPRFSLFNYHVLQWLQWPNHVPISFQRLKNIKLTTVYQECVKVLYNEPTEKKKCIRLSMLPQNSKPKYFSPVRHDTYGHDPEQVPWLLILSLHLHAMSFKNPWSQKFHFSS